MRTKNTIPYKYAAYFFFLLFLAALLGFWKSYISIFPEFITFVKNPKVIHFHTFVVVIWVILLFVQPVLIRLKKYNIHRFLGKLTYFLVPLIVGSFLALMYTSYYEFNLEDRTLYELGIFFYFQAMHTIFFTVFYILAVINKRNVAVHAGYMISTGLIFINPILRRVFMNAFNMSFTVSETIAIVVTDLAIVGLIIYAKRKNLNYKLYYIVFGMFMVYHIRMLLMIYIWNPGT